MIVPSFVFLTAWLSILTSVAAKQKYNPKKDYIKVAEKSGQHVIYWANQASNLHHEVAGLHTNIDGDDHRKATKAHSHEGDILAGKINRQRGVDKYTLSLSNKDAFKIHQKNCHRGKKYMAAARSVNFAARCLRNRHDCLTKDPPNHIEAENERQNALSVQPTKDAYRAGYRKDKHKERCGARSLLNRPSQTYSMPVQQKKDYYSTKQDLLLLRIPSQSEPSEYFTPDSSPRNSMASRKPSRRSLRDPVPSTRTPSGSAASSTRAIYTVSTSSSISSTSLEAHSIFSDYLTTPGSIEEPTIVTQSSQSERRRKSASQITTTTRSTPTKTVTTTIVPASVYGLSAKGTAALDRTSKSPAVLQPKTTTSSASANTRPTEAVPVSGASARSGRPPPPTSTPRKPQQSTTTMSIAAATANGTRPFNAFAPMAPSASKPVNDTTTTTAGQDQLLSSSSSTPTRSTSKSTTPPTADSKQFPSIRTSSGTPNGHVPQLQSLPPPNPPSSQTYSSFHNRRQYSTSKVQQGIMANMSAVLEEDEDGPFTPDIESPVRMLRHTVERGRNRGQSQGRGSFSVVSSSDASASQSSLGSVTATASKPTLHRRRSRSLDSSSSFSAQSNTKQHTRAAQTLSSEIQALNLASHTHGELPSNGTPGYTSLVLPRAPRTVPGGVGVSATASDLTPGGRFGLGPFAKFHLPTLKLNFGLLGTVNEGKVDLTQSGLAQTTMASVEVVRGLAGRRGAPSRNGSWKVKDVLGALGRKGSLSGRPEGPLPLPLDQSQFQTHPPEAVKNASTSIVVDGTILGFTSYRSPPSYVPGQSVLVQVWAVAVDGVDGRLVGVKFGREVETTGGGKGANNGRNDKEDDEEVGEVHHQDQERDDDDETWEEIEAATQSTPSTTKNPFAALGRSLSLSLSLKRGKEKGRRENGRESALGKGFSLRRNERESRDSTPTASLPVPRVSSSHVVDKKRSLERNSTTAVGSMAEVVPSGKVPSKPQKLKARSKPEVREEVQVQPSSSSVVKEKQKDQGSTGQKERGKEVGQRQRQRQKSQTATVSKPDEKQRPGTREKERPRPLPPVPVSTSSQTPRAVPGRTASMSSQRSTRAGKLAEVGYIPGRSFVGRVLEVGFELGDEVLRRGEWVVGLLDVRKAGALAEFIVVDRHRVHRVPHPHKAVQSGKPDAPPSPVWVSSPRMGHSTFGDVTGSEGNGSKKGKERERSSKQEEAQQQQATMLTLEELAILPLCGVPAYRAVRTFMYAFPGQLDFAPNQNSRQQSQSTAPIQGRMQPYRRRALVLRGHDGAGAMAVQMLVLQGWRVSVHIPLSCVPANASQALVDAFMHVMEDRAREWGADEVIFDDGEAVGEGGDVESGGGDGDDGRAAAVRVIETLREEGDTFDAVLDTVGGKEVREAGERLLRSPAATNTSSSQNSKLRGYFGQFTTLVGDTPERPIPSVADALRANLRSFRTGQGHGQSSGTNKSTTEGGPCPEGHGAADADPKFHKVGHAWVSVAHEVEWEGEDVGETLGAVLRLAMEQGIRPLVEDAGGGILGRPRVVPFEKAPRVFVDNGPLADGGTVVVKIAR